MASKQIYLLFHYFLGFFTLVYSMQFENNNIYVLESKLIEAVNISEFIDDNIDILQYYLYQHYYSVPIDDQSEDGSSFTNGKLTLLYEIQRTGASLITYEDRIFCSLLSFGWNELDVFYHYKIKSIFRGNLKATIASPGFYIEMCMDFKKLKVFLRYFKLKMPRYIQISDVEFINGKVQNYVNSHFREIVDSAEKGIKITIKNELDQLNKYIHEHYYSLKLLTMENKSHYFKNLIKKVKQLIMLNNIELNNIDQL